MDKREDGILGFIWQMQHDLNCKIGLDTINHPKKEYWGMQLILAMEQELAELKDCYNWKWWSSAYKKAPKGSVMNWQNAKVEYIDIMHFFVSLGQTLGFTPEEVFRIYKQKWEVNNKRQDEGYNHVNKTEDDNEGIK